MHRTHRPLSSSSTSVVTVHHRDPYPHSLLSTAKRRLHEASSSTLPKEVGTGGDNFTVAKVVPRCRRSTFRLSNRDTQRATIPVVDFHRNSSDLHRACVDSVELTAGSTECRASRPIGLLSNSTLHDVHFSFLQGISLYTPVLSSQNPLILLLFFPYPFLILFLSTSTTKNPTQCFVSENPRSYRT